VFERSRLKFLFASCRPFGVVSKPTGSDLMAANNGLMYIGALVLGETSAFHTEQ
jgi:hypothetical protein